MEPCLDKLGTSIEVGSYIVYGSLLGRSAGLHVGKVLRIERKKTSEWSTEEHWAIRVVSIDDGWSHRPVGLHKEGTLMFPERICVVQDTMLPPVYKQLLDSHKKA